jgi:hypothetical protein
MMRLVRGMLAGALALVAALAAQAVPVTVAQSLGGIDSFNADGVAEGFGSQASGVLFDSFNIGFGDAEGTDALGGDVALSFNLVRAAGTVTDARLVLRTGGYGLYGLAKVFFNGTLVGTLTDGDNSRPRDLVPYFDETAHVDAFDLLLAGAVFDASGVDLVEIVVVQDDPDYLDWGSVDYAVLEVTSDDTGGGTVPEPASLALAALGLAAARAASTRGAAWSRAGRAPNRA